MANLITFDEFRDMISRCTGVSVTVPDLTDDPQVPFEKLGMDSLGVLGVVTELENRLGISLDEAAATAVPADLLRIVHQRLLADGRLRRGHTEASTVIAAPFDDVWRITNDVPGWTTLFSEYAAATVLEQRGQTVVFRLTTRPDDNDVSWSWVSERTPDYDSRTVRARRVETGAFAFMDITWTYTQLPEGVGFHWAQDFAMKPDAPVDDDWMTANITANSLIQQARIRHIIETGTPPGDK